MKSFKFFIALFAVIAVIACNQTEKDSETDEIENVVSVSEEDEVSASDEIEVAAAVDSLNNAFVDPEKDLLENLAADGLTYGHSSGLIQNKAEFIDDLLNGDFDFTSVDISKQSINMAGETAVVRHIFSAKATNAGEPVDVRIGNVLVFQKQEDEWKLFARQSFKL